MFNSSRHDYVDSSFHFPSLVELEINPRLRERLFQPNFVYKVKPTPNFFHFLFLGASFLTLTFVMWRTLPLPVSCWLCEWACVSCWVWVFEREKLEGVGPQLVWGKEGREKGKKKKGKKEDVWIQRSPRSHSSSKQLTTINFPPQTKFTQAKTSRHISYPHSLFLSKYKLPRNSSI